ncbi:MAG: phosphate/phosphite/phosphonate ABC transporter substrate-binding protein [Candidatus Krumholzibacteriota bacterium]|nr:phosphate/phosphite/phosphonate ABC transporter substrate-binding protein [Candidatus Krumholzibacteriota bacterium]
MKSQIGSPSVFIKISLSAFIIFFALTITSFSRPLAAERLVLGVHPYLSFKETRERFTPLARYLESELETEVVLQIGMDYEDHIRSIGDGKVDIAYIGPNSYIKLVDKFGRHPLLGAIETSGTDFFTGRIIVREESPVKDISELKGKRIAFADRNSTMGYVVPLYLILQHLKRDDFMSNAVFAGSHVNVARGVLAGDFDAGAVKEEVYLSLMGKSLRAIGTTPPIHEHLFIARKGLSPELISDLRDLLSTMKDTPRGVSVMTSIHGGMTDISGVDDSDYDELRAIINFLEKNGD